MAAHEAVSGHQFGEMQRRLGEEGGFTYHPRKQSFVTSGYSVAAHPAAELRTPSAETSTQTLRGYVAGSAPTWKGGERGGGRGQEMIGGWRSEGHDVLDIPKVYPNTPQGHSKSRRSQVLRGQEASFSLHTGEEESNPFHSANAPTHEMARLAMKRPEVALQQPEVQAWTEGPARKAQWDREAKQKARQS
jgi:hypothetical protein